MVIHYYSINFFIIIIPFAFYIINACVFLIILAVTQCRRPREALSLIRNGLSKFDIVISSVDFSSDMNGVQFLEIIDRETSLPVVSKSFF